MGKIGLHALKLSGMGEVAKWFTQNLWAGLAYGAAAGFVVAALLTLLMHRSRDSGDEDEGNNAHLTQERQRLLLLCGDAKALADLAIQRYMTNPEFLRRLQTQPCYDALIPHLSEEFLSQTALQTNDARGSTLATLFRREIERLEREWSGKSAWPVHSP